MKSMKLLVALLFIFLGSTTKADCNLKVATAAGLYLDVLEKAELRKYQNNSVCEVLSYEFWSCSEIQKKKLESTFNLKGVLGSYCQPHLSPPKSEVRGKEHFAKGADLYSWRDHGGYIWYALLPGTNRTKGTSELIENKVSPGYLKEELKKLPAETPVAWNSLGAIEDKSNLEFSLPEDRALNDILGSAKSAGLKITVIK